MQEGQVKRRALVTGAHGGIGMAVSHALSASCTVMEWERGKGYSNVDVIVHCAGARDASPIKTCCSFWDLMEVHCALAFNLVKLHAPGMMERGWGRIVVLGSLWGQRGRKDRFAYSASKAALEALTRSVAIECAPAVLCNTVVPGFIDTRATREALPEHELERIEKDTPLGRLGRAEEVAELVRWLCVENTFVTGQRIVIDGGWSA